MIACSTGAGSARPVVSSTTRRNGAMRPLSRFLQQILQRGDEIAANGAADATRTHHDHVAVDFLDEQMIESDIAKFIDQHERVGEFGRGQQTIEQRRLAGAQKPRQHGEGQRRRRAPRGPASLLPRQVVTRRRVLIAHWPASPAPAAPASLVLPAWALPFFCFSACFGAALPVSAGCAAACSLCALASVFL